MQRRIPGVRLAALAGVGALVLTGCLQSGSDESSSGSSSSSGGTEGAGGTDPGDGEVEILGAFVDTEADAFAEALAPFEEESGIDVKYQGDNTFTTLVRQNVTSGNPPDIGLFPQPGLLLDLASEDSVVPIEEFLEVGGLEDSLIPGLLDSSTDGEGTMFGAPMRVAVKSLIWVPKKAWEDGGYAEPKTYQELVGELSEQIKGDGIAPWCIGYESGTATGWVGTDWVEEMVLRTGGPEDYDKWTSHEVPFDDAIVQDGFEAYDEIVSGEGLVFGGRDGIINTAVDAVDDPQFEGSKPGCMMQRQGNFVIDFYSEDVQKNLDDEVKVIAMPPYEGGFDGDPVLGGGDIAALFNGEDDEAKEVMEFLTSDEFGAEWAKAGGWLSPHTTFDESNYPDQTTKDIAKIVSGADVFRYDGSDLMPAEVGAGSFWEGMVEWTRGEADTATVTADIEDSWPSSE